MLSVIIPVYNEAENLRPLREQTVAALEALGKPFEVIFINDGSTDESGNILASFATEDKRLKAINFRRNFGQTAAIMAGIDYASGTILIPMDADLQNDPKDIGRLLAKLDEGYDVVSGWRQNRQDPAISRKLLSFFANKLISRISGVRLNDYGCTLKAYRRDVLKDVKLYGEMHRFIPIYSSWYGGRICEIPVTHHARTHGTSKYGANRIIKVVLDLIVVTFLSKYDTKPIYVFGTFGVLLFLASMLAGVWALILKFFFETSFVQTPLPLLTVMCFIMSMMSILMGLLAELLTRIYYESQDKSVYLVKNTHNFSDND